MRKRTGTFCMILGAVLVLAALSLFLRNQYQDKRAEKLSGEILSKVEDAADNGREDPLPDPYETEMTVVDIDGYGYIGYVMIPALDLELPVMSEWDYTRLQIAPCRYSGSVKTEDLVIAAHNYRSHFGRINTLQIGDEVYFTDMDGISACYTAAEIDDLNPAAVEEMTAGEYDLTLFTCTYSGQSRVTVRCIKE